MQIRIFATLRQLTGQAAVEVQAGSGDSVRLALDQLVAQHPILKDKVWDERGDLSSTVNVFVNGRNIIWLDGLDTVWAEGDSVAIFPPVAGG